MKFKLDNVLKLFFVLVVLSCSDTKTGNQKSENQQQRDDSLKLKLDVMAYDKTRLMVETDSVILKWPVYNDLKNEINRIENYTISDVISNISTLEKAIDSLEKTVPKEVDTFPVMSRVKVLNTKAKHLLMLSKKQTPKLKDIKLIAEEIPAEFNALNIQLNELFIELPNFEELNNE